MGVGLVNAVVPGLKASSYWTKSELFEDETSDDTSEVGGSIENVAGTRRGGYQSALREVGHRVYRGPTGPSDIQRGHLDQLYSQIDAIQEQAGRGCRRAVLGGWRHWRRMLRRPSESTRWPVAIRRPVDRSYSITFSGGGAYRRSAVCLRFSKSPSNAI